MLPEFRRKSNVLGMLRDCTKSKLKTREIFQIGIAEGPGNLLRERKQHSDTAPTLGSALGGQSAPLQLCCPQPSAPPAYCSAAADDGAPRQRQQRRAQRRQHGQHERPEHFGRATRRIRSGSYIAGAQPNTNQSAPRQLQHGGQHGRAGQRAARHVTHGSQRSARRTHDSLQPSMRDRPCAVCSTCQTTARSCLTTHSGGWVCKDKVGLFLELCESRAYNVMLCYALSCCEARASRFQVVGCRSSPAADRRGHAPLDARDAKELS
jgi:hypothetical protein